MFAPAQTVTLDDGSSIELGTVWKDRPLALVLLRHLGCIFCREIVARLREMPDANLLFVAGERTEECAEFRARMESPHRFISDPGRTLYEAFGLTRGGLTQVIHPRVVTNGISALRAGLRQGRPTSDPMQLGGAFVIDRSGCVDWEFRSADISDNPTAEQILGALARAGEREVKFYPFAGIAQR